MTALPSFPWSSDNSVPLDVADVVLAIQNTRRRHALLLLGEREGPMTVGELAEGIAAIENDKIIPEINCKERKRVYIALTQSHLHTLDETGVVAYHERQKKVWSTDATEGVADLIRHLESVCESGI